MPDTQTATPVSPADMPADAWITFDAFAHLIPSMSKRTWERGSLAGRFPAGKRITEKSVALYRAGDIAEFFAGWAAEVARPNPLLAIIEGFDANRTYTGAQLKALITGSAEVGQ